MLTEGMLWTRPRWSVTGMSGVYRAGQAIGKTIKARMQAGENRYCQNVRVGWKIRPTHSSLPAPVQDFFTQKTALNRKQLRSMGRVAQMGRLQQPMDALEMAGLHGRLRPLF